MEIPLLKGRIFDERDTAESEQVVMINETFARRFWPDEDPLGKRISFSGLEGPWHTIIGVVGDTRHLGLEAEAGLEMYLSYSQSPIHYMALVARSNQDPATIASSIKNEVLGLDSDLPVYAIRPMEELISRSLAPRRFQMILLGSFAALALILAAVGIYGVMSYSVTQRTHEIGIRMALGATSRDVVKLIVGHGMALTLIGVAAGLVAARLLTRLIETLLYEVSYSDTTIFIGVSILLAAVASAACAVPARRATKVDPMIALRYE
jgi:putative ABC transport system permease protein